MNIALVHGFLDTGGVFRAMQRRLTAAGHRCIAPTLRPTDGRTGIECLAARLAEEVDTAFGPGAPLAIVGFSMGSLVARCYLQDLGGAARTRIVFAVAGPHRGTLSAYLYPGLGTRQMRPGSAFLRHLEEAGGALAAVVRVSYWTPFDLMILPASHARWEDSEIVRVRTLLHRWVPSSRRVCDDVVRRIALVEAEGRAP